MRLLFAAVVAAAATAVTVAPASAGGWWSSVHVEGHEFGVGETVIATSEAFFASRKQADRAQRADYYAYLVSDYDRTLVRSAMRVAEPARWWAVPPEATVRRIGTVRIHSLKGNVGQAVARMTIPPVEPGRYFFMFCDAGCRRPFAHAVPTAGVWITPDQVAARGARRAEAVGLRMSVRLAELRAEVALARRDAQAALAEAGATSTAQQETDVAATNASPRPAWHSLAWAFVAGMAVAAVLGACGAAWGSRTARRRAAVRERQRWRPVPGAEHARSEDFEPARR